MSGSHSSSFPSPQPSTQPLPLTGTPPHEQWWRPWVPDRWQGWVALALAFVLGTCIGGAAGEEDTTPTSNEWSSSMVTSESSRPPMFVESSSPLVSVSPTSAAPSVSPIDSPEANSVYYRNCDAARAAGAAPLYRGEPGYRPELDRDGDGVACEDTSGVDPVPPAQEPPVRDDPPAPPPAPEANSVYYRNCDAARAAGAAPLYRGEPGYRPGLDRDGDGVACE